MEAAGLQHQPCSLPWKAVTQSLLASTVCSSMLLAFLTRKLLHSYTLTWQASPLHQTQFLSLWFARCRGETWCLLLARYGYLRTVDSRGHEERSLEVYGNPNSSEYHWPAVSFLQFALPWVHKSWRVFILWNREESLLSSLPQPSYIVD